jgi:hypothetical protein
VPDRSPNDATPPAPTAAEGEAARLPYESPRLLRLGTIEELTGVQPGATPKDNAPPEFAGSRM